MFGRTRWIVSFSVAGLLAVVVSALVLTAGGPETCEEWQDRYAEIAASVGFDPLDTSTGGTLQFINMGPFEELEESRPDGCPTRG